ncbi:MAG: hypothetical protein LBC38_01780 [Oscillospiraceae bacterium]|nr:hypothetical protein [Oscillospiraceae bacterium]
MNAAVLLAHEIGHNWFADADVDTWEDWLNETGAEWAALLYALHLGDEELFTRELESSTSGYANTPAIKTSDGSRPYEGVHSRGTALFYSIYLKYGADTVLWLLQTLAELSTPTTAYFISAVKAQRPELAEYIEYGLTAISY